MVGIRNGKIVNPEPNCLKSDSGSNSAVDRLVKNEFALWPTGQYGFTAWVNRQGMKRHAWPFLLGALPGCQAGSKNKGVYE